MAGTASKDNVAGDGSSSFEGMSSAGQNCQAGDLLAEWRSSEQVENDTPSTSPPYWDTDDEDDNGPKPVDLYGKFTWKIENFSQISKRELRSNAFEVGGYKWYILIYPQGCDVCNHLSLFLCVANHDRLLPGWSHFAQFTIAVVNKDPKKSKYSDTLHRFWKKEHDWGWKKFMELSKIVDGFIEADTLVIKAQVQVIREKANRPFRCLDRQYRRELVRVYLSNVENICRRFVEERRGMLSKLIEDRVSWSGFRIFWLGIDQNARRRMSRDKTDAVLKVIVKHFFVEKEVTSTLVMDSLYSGLKALEWQSESKRGINKSVDIDEMPTPIVEVENGMFILADDALVLLERTALEPLPPKDDKGMQSQGQSQNQNRTKDGSSSEEFNKDSVDRDEKRLTELGRRTLEIFVLTHIFSSKIEVAYQEVVAFKRQEELIREEEAAGQAESELRAKRIAAEKEKRAKKKQNKQKRNNRKGKEKNMSLKENVTSVVTCLKSSSYDEKNLENLSTKSEEAILEKISILDVSDASDTGAEICETAETGLEDRVGSPRTYDTDVSEVLPGAEASSSEVQNDLAEKKCRSAIDDSSSTCSTDSVPSVMNVPNKGSLTQNNISNRGKGRRQRVVRRRNSQINHDTVSLSSDAAPDVGHAQDAADNSRTSTPERETGLSLDGRVPLPESDILAKKEVPTMQNKPKLKGTDPHLSKADSSPSPTPLRSSTPGDRQSRRSCADSTELFQDTLKQVEKVASAMARHNLLSDKAELPKLPTTGMAKAAMDTSPLSRPSSAPIIPDVKPTACLLSTTQTQPSLSRSTSAFGRLSAPEVPSSTHNFGPLSYRNAIMGNASAWSNSSGYSPDTSSSGKGSLYSQPVASVVAASSTDTPIARPDQVPMRPVSSFNPKASVSGSHVAPGRLQPELGRSMLNASNFVNDAEHYPEDLASGPAVRQLQCSTTDEFPHLDIINYLLDEDHMDAKLSVNRRTFFPPSWQYGFPDNLVGADAGTSNASCRLNGLDQYYSDMSNGIYDPSFHTLDVARDLFSPEIDSPAYTGSEVDSWMLGQWPLGTMGSAMSGPGECNPRPYQVQDYSNLSCGVSGFIMYPPANGF